MTQAELAAFAKALSCIPEGTSRGQAAGKRYVATRTLFNEGKSIKLVAEELGGTDYISLNFYNLQSGARLKPCEMPAAKVAAFVAAYRPD